ncbi:heme acquisition protein HasA [Yersinia bercovieri]|uniref:heme acquisition protein HasA n=1 Tax=Yersinia bercovieri TaxID=634 RepID=UPI0005DAF440|nr:heme acquisition protein HasA [Yersinia bercovieri]MCB5304398.1 heme acquisition protein HasA [Yersinia bercovieri]CFQ42462.1 hemophore HasA [Yersinia bercovieri]
MSVTVQYNSEFADYTVSSYLSNWAETFGDMNQAETKDRGQFAGGDTIFSGTQYSIGSSHDTDMGMIVEGNLNYAFMAHTFHGQITNIQFGKDLVVNTDGAVGKHLNDLQVAFNDVDISGEFDATKPVAENRDSDMHKSVYGLMRGNAEPILEYFKAKDIDVDTAFKDMAIATQIPDTEMAADAPIIETVGVYDDAADMSMAA